MSIQLTVMSLDFELGAAPFTKVFDKREITLGRLPSNDLVLDRPEVSGYHARIRLEDGDAPTLKVKDLGSSNGTMVENTSLRAQIEVDVKPNQRIIIGNYLIKPTFQTSSGEVKKMESDNLLEGDTVLTSRLNSRLVEEALNETPLDVEATQNIKSYSDSATVAETKSPTVPPATAGVKSGTGLAVVDLHGAELSDIDFEASQLIPLVGTVLHKGSPLTGVRISAGALGNTTTDAQGKFSFAPILEGTSYSLEAALAGYIFEKQQGVIADSVGSVALTARKLLSISGTIRHRGKPLAGVTVEATELGSTVTDANGRYVFNNVPEDAKYTLKARKDNFVFAPLAK